MLVLGRHCDESIIIECYDQYGTRHEVSVSCVSIHSDRIRLGISAPKHMPVHRKEIYDRIKFEDKRPTIHPDYPCQDGDGRY